MAGLFAPEPWLGRILVALAIAAGAWVVFRIVEVLVYRRERDASGLPVVLAGRRATLYRLAVNVIRYVLAFIAAMMILSEFSVNASSLLAAAGVVGLAIAFGAQQMVQDVVNGVFLLSEDVCRVGDSIAIPSLAVTGSVLEVGLRATRVRGPAGQLIVVPNGLITELVNYSRTDGTVLVSVAIPVDPKGETDAVRRVLERVVEHRAADFKGLAVAGVTAVAPGAVTWTLTASVPAKDQARCSATVAEEALAALQAEGIAIAQA